ncbi:MAG TPA: CRTAC1 family protein [Gemmataceae bacterium]|nr:CRTAC1 family protein [Gemmataceae bacterium]
MPVEEPVPPAWFQDITEKSGLRFVHDAGPIGEYFMPQIMGSGVALFDFNNDNRLDIYLLQNGGPKGAKNRLYQQMPDGTFRDVTEGSGLDIAGYNMGVAIGDVNNDGRPDVLVTGYKGIRLFRNNGNGTFTDITRESGLEDPLWSMSASFVDYDRDGWLDLVVVNYIDYDPSRRCDDSSGRRDYCGPNIFHGTIAKLYRNVTSPERERREGERAAKTIRFQDVTMSSGLGQKPGPGLGVVCADFNGDGWPDILAANDGQPNYLWINQHDGTFREEAATRGLAYNGHGMSQGNMGIALGDIDGDGLFDVFITHLTDETNTLWRQGPRGWFQDETVRAGLADPFWRGTGFGTVLSDFNHDGALDLAIVNGRVLRGPEERGSGLDPFWRPYAERNQLFANEGKGQFRELSATDPFGQRLAVSRGLACGDIDGDGAMDLLVTTVAGPARLYRNIAPKEGHWLLVRAIDPAHQRDAYGAVVTVHAGGRRWMGSINPGQSYLCSNDPRAHFGLGSAERVDSIRVRWPDGESAEEIFPGGAADRVVVLRRGEGKTAEQSVNKPNPRP